MRIILLTWHHSIMVIIIAYLTTAARFGHVISAEQIAIDNEIPLQTEPPTLPIISVTLPAGVTTEDEDIADVIDSLIQGNENNNKYTNTPTEMPTKKPYKSRKETMFRQEFKIDHPREFTKHELKAFEELHQQYTVYFAPLSPAEVEKTITTKCTVNRQSLDEDTTRRLLTDINSRTLLRGMDRNLVTMAQQSLYVDFTMTYESTHYNVTEYPKLFQNWSTHNLDVVLHQMQFMNINVKSVDVPRRIVVTSPTQSPSTASTTASASTTNINNKDEESMIIARTTDNTAPNVVPTEQNKWSVAAIVVFSIALLLAVATLFLGVSVFLSKRPLSCLEEDVEVPSNTTTRSSCEAGNFWKGTNHPDDTTSTIDSVLGIDSHLAHYP